MPGKPQNVVPGNLYYDESGLYGQGTYESVTFLPSAGGDEDFYHVAVSPGNMLFGGDNTTREIRDLGPLRPMTLYTFTLYTGANSTPENSVTWTKTTGPGAPEAPTAVSAVGPAGFNTITLTWTAPTSNNGSPITGYNISHSSGTTNVSNVLTITLTDLQTTSKGYFSVVAVNAFGQSVRSNYVDYSIEILSPGTPTDVTAVAGNGSATVSWTAPVNTGASEIVGYTITPSVGSPITVSNILTATFTGLASGTPLTFTVRAINSNGASDESSASSPVTPTELTSGVPSSVLNVTGVPRVASAIISWSPPISEGSSPITGYKVICIPDNKKPNLAPATARSLTVIGIKNAVKTMYTVVAINASGQSDSVALTSYPLPGAPKVKAVRGASGTIKLSWTAKPSNIASPITGYDVSVVSPLPTPTGMLIPTPLVTATGGSVSVVGLTNGTPYVFLVKAISAIGTGPGKPIKAIIPASIPDRPTSFTGIKAVKAAGLSWVAPTNTGGLPLTGYIISYTLAGVVKTVKLKLVTSTIIKGLTNDIAYSFTIQSTTAAGSSIVGSPVTVTPGIGL